MKLKVNLPIVGIHSFFKLFIYLFLEEGREAEREGEKHQCVVASRSPPTGTWPATQACALTGNQTSDPLVCRPALHPLNHTSQSGKATYFRKRFSEMLDSLSNTSLYIWISQCLTHNWYSIHIHRNKYIQNLVLYYLQ